MQAHSPARRRTRASQPASQPIPRQLHPTRRSRRTWPGAVAWWLRCRLFSGPCAAARAPHSAPGRSGSGSCCREGTAGRAGQGASRWSGRGVGRCSAVVAGRLAAAAGSQPAHIHARAAGPAGVDAAKFAVKQRQNSSGKGGSPRSPLGAVGGLVDRQQNHLVVVGHDLSGSRVGGSLSSSSAPEVAPPGQAAAPCNNASPPNQHPPTTPPPPITATVKLRRCGAEAQVQILPACHQPHATGPHPTSPNPTSALPSPAYARQHPAAGPPGTRPTMELRPESTVPTSSAVNSANSCQPAGEKSRGQHAGGVRRT